MYRHIRAEQLLRPGKRVGAAVSGGADSVALLRLLLGLRDDLGILLSVVHVNHQLRADAGADEEFVRELAERFGLAFHIRRAAVREYAAEHKLSLEAAGREVRRLTFAEIAREQRLDVIATGHTLDDQAETVLLKFLRGAWTRGLAGIYPAVTDLEGATLVRPLLAERRAELRRFLNALQQPWREDATNQDPRFTRNRVRHELLPLLERGYNPGIAEVLSGTAEIAREEERYWQQISEGFWAGAKALAAKSSTARLKSCPDTQPSNIELPFNDERFRRMSVAEQRRVLSFALSRLLALDFVHVETARLGILTGKNASLPEGWDLSVNSGALTLIRR